MFELIEKKRFIILVLSAIVLLISVLYFTPQQEDSQLYDKPGRTWMQADMIQCLGNPWERNWLEIEIKESSDYPKWNVRQFSIIMNYYAQLDIKIHDIKTERTQEIVCQACSCPTGETLYLLVYDAEVEKMHGLGYKTID